jgi:hypothetical protein
MIGLLIKSEDIDLYKWEFEYKSRRRAMTEDERIKEDLEMELHIKTENDKMINKIMKTIRDKRDVLLARSDYYLSMPDIKITDEKKEEILKYRQELRDFPSKITDGVYSFEGDDHLTLNTFTTANTIDKYSGTYTNVIASASVIDPSSNYCICLVKNFVLLKVNELASGLQNRYCYTGLSTIALYSFLFLLNFVVMCDLNDVVGVGGDVIAMYDVVLRDSNTTCVSE